MPDDARSALGATPTAFFQTHEKRLTATSGIGPVLDLACGHGRHSMAAADLGLDVLAIDRNGEALDSLGHIQPRNHGKIRTLRVDLESASPPSLEPLSFGAVLVFRYLHRPLDTSGSHHQSPAARAPQPEYTSPCPASSRGPRLRADDRPAAGARRLPCSSIDRGRTRWA